MDYGRLTSVVRQLRVPPRATPGLSLKSTKVQYRAYRRRATVTPQRAFPSPETDEHWMRVALELADEAASGGEIPIGCVVVGPNGLLEGSGRNRREVDADPTAHAEVLALRAAAKKRSEWRLDGSTLYVTLEPCAMCAGALVNARISRVVFGALDPKAGALMSLYEIGQDRRLNHQFEVDGGIFATESIRKLQQFFGSLRAEGQK